MFISCDRYNIPLMNHCTHEAIDHQFNEGQTTHCIVTYATATHS